MESKVCTQCKSEIHINSYYNKCYYNNTERKQCNCKRGLKRCYENRDKISKQQKTYCV